ncbi:hypothetical protein VNI00_019005 [Paramarasmius palmivorus]|uniref:Uncharacterized protein n=1 Tax=Paramarasmius palmivorus TaxID=297713 RepID=A0AAW0AS95_9AGAR
MPAWGSDAFANLQQSNWLSSGHFYSVLLLCSQSHMQADKLSGLDSQSKVSEKRKLEDMSQSEDDHDTDNSGTRSHSDSDSESVGTDTPQSRLARARRKFPHYYAPPPSPKYTPAQLRCRQRMDEEVEKEWAKWEAEQRALRAKRREEKAAQRKKRDERATAIRKKRVLLLTTANENENGPRP